MNNYKELSEEQQDLFRTGVKSLLHEGEMTINFIKADGTTRLMTGTLSESLIPEEKRPKIDPDKPVKTPSTTACNVFDIEKQEWRSFKYESLIDLSPKV
jgi:hypothetical protein